MVSQRGWNLIQTFQEGRGEHSRLKEQPKQGPEPGKCLTSAPGQASMYRAEGTEHK